jgi:hypothetical protein
MKKIVSIIMAAAMVFALAVPAFAAKVESTVTATLQAPKIAMTIGKVSVVANPYKIKVKDPTDSTGQRLIQDQIVNAPVACINKSDVKLNISIVVTPTTKNNVTFVDNVADGQVKDSSNVPIPGAKLTLSAAVNTEDYVAGTSEAPSSWTYTFPIQGAPNVMATGLLPAQSETATSYTAVASNAITPITLAAAEDITKGDSLWFKITGDLNTDVDWTSWKDSSNKPANLEVGVAFFMTPVVNATA